MEGTGEGCGFFCSPKLPIYVQCLNNFVADCGSKFIPQNSPTVQLGSTLIQSHAVNKQAPCPLFESGPPLKSCSTVTLYTGEVTPTGKIELKGAVSRIISKLKQCELPSN